MRKGVLPPYTLVPHNAERYTVVVHYTNREGFDSHEKGPWGEGWAVAAWSDAGEPLVMDRGLMTVERLLERYEKDADEVSWDVQPSREWAPGLVRHL